MKYLLLLLILNNAICKLNAQIPNGSFETWIISNNLELPSNWSTNQTDNIIRILKSESSIDGNYSLRLESNAGSAFQNCSSWVSQTINFEQAIGEEKAVTFFAKSILNYEVPSEGVFLRVDCRFYLDGELYNSDHWETYEEILNFQKFQIPIPHANIDQISITITGGAINGPTDGCHNSSISWIDELSIDNYVVINSINDNLVSYPILIYPNPTTDWIKIISPEVEIHFYELLGIDGKLYQSGIVQNQEIKLHTQYKGYFQLRLYTEENQKSSIITKPLILK